ncbi:MAG: hypothetical protein DWQ01_17765 [Planctomycetota bacterium]|nr:MAG: hypothetical protein DWQ01_17765 [Planctomycetota bacterium]
MSAIGLFGLYAHQPNPQKGKPMQRKLMVPVCLLLISAALTAQTPQPVFKAETPKHAGVFKMSTGELLPSSPDTRAPQALLFNAALLTNYYSVPGTDQEWLDEGMLLDRSDGPNPLEQMNCFEFQYCSTEADATQNSGTITLAFYDETIVCTGPTNGGNFALGGYVCAYDIVGLPLGAANGAIQCWIVTVDLRWGFECPAYLDNQSCYTGKMVPDQANGKLFGWSFIPRNENTGPILSKGGSQSAGIDNSFVWFDQFGALVGCFWFGGTPWANFAMKMWGYPDPDCRIYFPCNPVPIPAGDILRMTVSKPSALSTERTFTITNQQTGQEYWLIVGLSSQSLSTPTGTLLVVPSVPPSPMFMANGTIDIDAAVASGQYIYIQGVGTTAGSGPPSIANLPLDWSNSWCDYIN